MRIGVRPRSSKDAFGRYSGRRPRASGHGRWLWLVLVLVGLVLGALVPLASAQGPLRVLLIDPGEPELVARIEGQTRDLAVVIERVAAVEALDLARVRALASERSARAVVLVRPRSDGGLEVLVVDALLGGERSREVPKPEGEPLSGSAMFEAAALAVRGELSSLLSKDAVQGAQPTQEPTPGEVADVPPPPPALREAAGALGAAAAQDETTPSEATSGIWSLRAGGRLARVDDPHFAVGPTLGIGLELGMLVLGLHATTAWPIVVRGDSVTVALRRHSLGMRADVLALGSPRVRLLLGADAGLVLYARNTESAVGALHATKDAISASGAFGASTELQWLPTPAVGAVLTLGVDLLPWPTRFAITRPSGRSVLERLSWYEPWVELCLLLRFGTSKPQPAPQ